MRTISSAQQSVLDAKTRSVWHKVRVKNASGTWITMTELEDLDWLDAISFQWTVDQPVPQVDFTFWKHQLGKGTLAPLDETSALNVDDASSYAALLDAGREIDWQTALMEIDTEPTAGDYLTIFHGEIDDVNWPGKQVSVVARDYLMSHLQDRWIETPTVYGGSQNVETVMQDILTAETDGRVTLWVPSSPGLSVPDRSMGPMRVLDALIELAQMPGWTLRSMWNSGSSEYQLKFFEPNRTPGSTDYDFTTDDYFNVTEAKISRRNVRNAIDVVYTDSAGARQTSSDTDATSISRFGRRWMGMFLRADDPIDTAGEADSLRDAALADLAEPPFSFSVDADFFPFVEPQDYYGFGASNTGDERWFSTAQELGLYGFRHEVRGGERRGETRNRTTLQTRGKPAGQYLRWHPWGEDPPINRRQSQTPGLPVVQGVEIDFDENGEATVSATGDEYTANLYVTVGNGTTPSDPTSGTNDGSISARGGSVDTGVAITTGNQAIVKVVAEDDAGKLGPVETVKFSRRLGQFHSDGTDRSVSGTTTETTLETITVPANKLGSRGALRLTMSGDVISNGAGGTFRINWGGVTEFTIAVPAGESVSVTFILFNTATGSQRGMGTYIDSAGTSDTSRFTASQDTTTDTDLEITGQPGDALEPIVALRVSMVEYIGTT